MGHRLALLMALAGCAAHASDAPGEGRFSLVYGLSSRAASLNSAVPVTVEGFSPSHLDLRGAYFFGGSRLGVGGNAAAEWFLATGPGFTDQVQSVPLSAVQLWPGALGRMSLTRGLWGEAQLGYGLGQIPTPYADSGEIVGKRPTRHGPFAAVGLRFDPGGPVSAEVSGRLMPVSLAEEPGSHYAADAQLSFGRVKLFNLSWAATAGYQYTVWRTVLRSAPLSYQAHRFGLGLAAAAGPGADYVPPPPTGPGEIFGTVLAAATGNPTSGAKVEIAGGPSASTDERGEFRIARAGPGQVTVKVVAGGYKPLEQTVTVPPEGEARVELRLQKPSGPGTITGRILSANPKGGTPLAGALVEVAGKEPVRTGEDGTFELRGVGPGPVSLALTAPGHKPGEEVVAVPPEAEAKVELSLQPAAKKQPATVRGLVRSVTGAAVAADIRIPEAKVRVRAGGDGQFLLQLAGGKYTVTIEAPGFVTQTRTIELADGDQAIFHVDLKPADR